MKKYIIHRSLWTAALIAGASFLMFAADHANAGSPRAWISTNPQAAIALGWASLSTLAFVWIVGSAVPTTALVWVAVLGGVSNVLIWNGTSERYDPTMQRLFCLAAWTVVPTLIVSVLLIAGFIAWLYQCRWNQPARRGSKSIAGYVRLACSLLLGGSFVGAAVSSALIKVKYDWHLLGVYEHAWELAVRIIFGLVPFILAGYGINRWRITTFVAWSVVSAVLISFGMSNGDVRIHGLPALSAPSAMHILMLIAAPGAVWQVLSFLGRSGGGGGGSYYAARSDSSPSYSSAGSSWSTSSSYSPTSSYDSNSSYSSSSSSCTPTYEQNKSYFDSQLAGGGSQQQRQGF